MSNFKLLTVAEASERLGFAPATVRAWILRRKIQYVKLGRSVRLESSEIDRLIAESIIPAREVRQ